MRLGAILMTVIGLGVAGGSVMLAKEYIDRSRIATQESAEEIPVVDVIVARQDIAFGQPIERHMLSTISWPRESVPAGVFQDIAEVVAERGTQPRRARRALSQGELLLKAKVSEFGEKVTITQTLGNDQRAMAIKVSAATAVGGFVTPGDFVDVVMTQGSGDSLRAVTILQNIKVIGVDQEADEQVDTPDVARTVTVAVTADQGQRLALAQRAGALSLTLRHLQADEPQELSQVKLSDILQDAPQEETDSRKVVVRRGIQAEVFELN